MVLEHSGWKTEKEMRALQTLFQCTGILEPQQTLAQRFPVREEPRIFAEDIAYLIQETQDKLRSRAIPQERWETSVGAWVMLHQCEILTALKTLGMFQEYAPRVQNIDGVCIFGATLPTMKKRIKYGCTMIAQKKVPTYYIVLAGERKAGPRDGSEAVLKDIAHTYCVPAGVLVTETVLARYAYDQSDVPHKEKMIFHVVDTIEKNGLRPTTETTLEDGLRWFKRKGVKRVCFVSNAPFVHYQKTMVAWVAERQKSRIKYETIGEGVMYDYKDKEKSLECAKRALDGLASFMWAEIPRVLCKSQFNLTRESVERFLKPHYERCPMIYDALLEKAS